LCHFLSETYLNDFTGRWDEKDCMVLAKGVPGGREEF
jgi:hypothetical protein